MLGFSLGKIYPEITKQIDKVVILIIFVSLIPGAVELAGEPQEDAADARRSPPDGRQTRGQTGAQVEGRSGAQGRRPSRAPRPRWRSPRRRRRRRTPSSRRDCPRRSASASRRCAPTSRSRRSTEEFYYYGPRTGWAYRYLRGETSLCSIMILKGRLYGIIALDAAAQAKVAWETLTEVGQAGAQAVAHGTPALLWLDVPLDGTGATDFKACSRPSSSAVPSSSDRARARVERDAGRKNRDARDVFLPGGVPAARPPPCPHTSGARPTEEERDETTDAMGKSRLPGRCDRRRRGRLFGRRIRGHHHQRRRAVARRGAAGHERLAVRGRAGELRGHRGAGRRPGPDLQRAEPAAPATRSARWAAPARTSSSATARSTRTGRSTGWPRRAVRSGSCSASAASTPARGSTASREPTPTRRAGATIFAGRVTTPTFGAGLVELIPDSTILAIASRAAGVDPRRGALRHHPPHRRAVRARSVARGALRLEGRARQRDRLRRRRLPERDGHHHHQLRPRQRRQRLRHREPRQPRRHQRHHQRLPG